jgi:hypothetical protein
MTSKNSSYKFLGMEFAPVWIPIERRLQVIQVASLFIEKRNTVFRLYLKAHSKSKIFGISQCDFIILDICCSCLDSNIYVHEHIWHSCFAMDVVLLHYL